MKVSLHTLGCKVNQYETQEITEQLLKNGFSVTLSDKEADIYIVNSCTVTAESDRKTRQLVRRLKKLNANGIVILTGCMPQAFPDMASALTEADIVIGNKNNTELISKLKAYLDAHNRIVDIHPHETGEAFCGTGITDFNERTRAIVKIQDGCDRYCSYCIIPTARGRVRFKPLAEIKAETEKLGKAGYCEAVLVGINLSSYGKGSTLSLPDAVNAAADTEEIKRIRLGSLEPDHLTPEIIAALKKQPKLCAQFHISLQSGCDKTLKRMNRHYTAQEYRELTENLRAAFPDCTLTTDVMVGFAGETQEDFEETVAFVREIGFEKVHIFPYSVREGTRAASFDGQIEKAEKERRVKVLSHTADAIRRAFLKAQIGKTVSVLLETKTDGEYGFGYTANYTPVKIKNPACEAGELVDVTVTSCDGEYCYA